MLPGTVVMSPISHIESEFQSHFNTLTLEPQDVLDFGRQIASGMVSKDLPKCLLDTVSQDSSTSPGVLG